MCIDIFWRGKIAYSENLSVLMSMGKNFRGATVPDFLVPRFIQCKTVPIPRYQKSLEFQLFPKLINLQSGNDFP